MIKRFEKFFEDYKLEIESDLKAKEYAIRDIIQSCDSYYEISKYINSLYVHNDNIHVMNMFESIVQSILHKLEEDRTMCEVMDLIRDSIFELDIHFDKKWRSSKNKNSYKRRKIKVYLKSLVDGPNIDVSIFGWKEFIRKQLTHAKYEDSFVEEKVFDKYQTQLSIGRLPRLRDYVFSDTINEDDIVEDFKNILNSEMQLKKSDLKVTMDIKDKNGNVILSKGDLVEVKYKDWGVVDTLGEFFALSKGNLSKKYPIDPSVVLGREKNGGYLITDIFRLNPDIFKKYNDIIQRFYDILTKEDSEKGDSILGEIKESMSGIMFKENRYVKKEDLIFKWSLMGQRKHENRLSITHEVIDGAKIYMYIDDPLDPHFRNPKVY